MIARVTGFGFWEQDIRLLYLLNYKYFEDSSQMPVMALRFYGLPRPFPQDSCSAERALTWSCYSQAR